MRGFETFHPFPARMAPELAVSRLASSSKTLRVLDPMSGSGTTLYAAQTLGHEVVGFDADPLAVLLSGFACDRPEAVSLLRDGEQVLATARDIARSYRRRYPALADYETRRYIDYWFDRSNQIQLTALSEAILARPLSRNAKALRVVLSKTIITKDAGVSLAADVSHSRPHRVFSKARYKAFELFERRLRELSKLLRSELCATVKPALIRRGDARHLAVESGTIDWIVTSPPYLTAIDYMRGHKLSLVWLGHNVSQLRGITTRSVGACSAGDVLGRVAPSFVKGDVSPRSLGIVNRYVQDMERVVFEWARVLRTSGRVTCVIGDCVLEGAQCRNSELLEGLARSASLKLRDRIVRQIPDDRRYLPPPRQASSDLKNRLREEVVLDFSAS
jgi:hypothetical protein